MRKQSEIINELKVLPMVDPEFEINRRVQLIKDALNERGFKRLILGISGGQDSTLAGTLCQMAINELREATNDSEYQFIAMRLPYGMQLDEDDCQKALQVIKPDQVITYDIKPSVDAHVNEYAKQGITISDHDKGNIKARERMVAQYIVASTNGLVVGTDHAAEAICGFFTKWGDSGADVIPLFGLNKRQGKALCQYLNIPQSLYLKVPTADLEDGRPGLADEVALGVSYLAIDDYLEGKSVTDEEKQIIEGWHKRTEHKRANPRNLYENFPIN